MIALAAPHVVRHRWVTVWEAPPLPHWEEMRRRMRKIFVHTMSFPFPIMGGFQTGIWRDAATATLSGDFGGWAGETCRVVIASAQLSNTGLQKVRITWQAQSAGVLDVTKAYIGMGGGATAYAFGGTPVQRTASAASSFQVPSGGTVVDDPTNFSITPGVDLVVSFRSTTTSVFRFNNTSTGYSFYFLTPPSDDVATQAATGYSGPYGSIKACCFNKIEAFG